MQNSTPLNILSLDELARQNHPLQRMDARIKIVVTMAFIVIVMSFPKFEISALLPFVLFPVVTAITGMIPFRRLLNTLLAAATFAVLLGLANPLLDREPMAMGAGVVIARGWFSFASIVIRFALAASAAFILAASTGAHRISGSLPALGAPQAIAVQLWLMYRYIFVLGGEMQRLARSVQTRSSGKARLRPAIYARLAGNLLLRAFARAERMHQAMLARGFDGKMCAAQQSAISARELTVALLALAFFIVARVWNLSDALGRAVLNVMCVSS